MDTKPPEPQSFNFYRFTRPKRECLMVLLAVAALDGFFTRFIPADMYLASAIVTGVICAWAIIKWCRYDADEHNISLPRRFVPLMVCCPGPLIMLPIHFIRSRGWYSGAFACLKALLFCLLMVGLEMVGAFASRLFSH